MSPTETEINLSAPVWRHVDASGDCWAWTGAKSDGYGSTNADGRNTVAHRVIYETLAGPVPVGLTLDHLCRNRACVNPDHLEPVTNRVNILRGVSFSARNARLTHCPRGHEYSPSNTTYLGRGGRQCRQCHRVSGQRTYTSRRAVTSCPTCGAQVIRHSLRRHLREQHPVAA